MRSSRMGSAGIRRLAMPFVVCAVVCLAGLTVGCHGLSPDAPAAESGISVVSIQDLPPEARTVLELIERGGPFPFEKDGTVFHNFEGLLPKKSDGYYREYTVVTPGSSDRGARRIVAGQREERYYTDDHYNSFRLVVE
jgi:ribonuclease T1